MEQAEIASLAKLLGAKKVEHTADIVRHGEAINVPERIPLEAAVDILQRRIVEEEEVIGFDETIPVFPWEGARALKKVMIEVMGYTTTHRDWFDGPPNEIAVEVAFGVTETIPWAKYKVGGPKEHDHIACNTGDMDGRVVFRITGQFKRKYQALVKKVANKTKELALRDSIYRGQALRIVFRNDQNDNIPIPTPQFLDLGQVNLLELIYSDDLQRAIETNIYTPIRHSALCQQVGVPLKRGVLLAGRYGTGKTLCAYATAKVATEHKWTFIYIKNSNELPQAMMFAQMYAPAVVFAEDIDRETKGDRTKTVNEIINTLDGIDTKGKDIMTILTTNHIEDINAAMLRPGRLDVILEVTPPDAGAVKRLVKVYARHLLDPQTNLEEVGLTLSGQIPAVIREVVERSKLEWIRRTGGTTEEVFLSGEDINYAAKTVLAQKSLTDRPIVDHVPAIRQLGEALGAAGKEIQRVGGAPKQLMA